MDILRCVMQKFKFHEYNTNRINRIQDEVISTLLGGKHGQRLAHSCHIGVFFGITPLTENQKRATRWGGPKRNGEVQGGGEVVR